MDVHQAGVLGQSSTRTKRMVVHRIIMTFSRSSPTYQSRYIPSDPSFYYVDPTEIKHMGGGQMDV